MEQKLKQCKDNKAQSAHQRLAAELGFIALKSGDTVHGSGKVGAVHFPIPNYPNKLNSRVPMLSFVCC